MGKKRKRGGTQHSGAKGSPAPKRAHCNVSSNSSKYHDGLIEEGGQTRVQGSFAAAFANARGYIDPVTGQRGAFPGLDEYEHDLFCGPALDGVDYLRMVRSEARGVPLLLVAKPQSAKTVLNQSVFAENSGTSPYDDDDRSKDDSIEEGELEETDYRDNICYAVGGELLGEEIGEEGEEGEQEEQEEDTRCFYEDGTYTATAACIFPQQPPSPEKAALLEWHDKFVSKFRQLHEAFHDPNAKRPLLVPAPSALDSSIVQVSQSIPRKQEDWLHLFRTISPTPAFLWRLDHPTVLKLLKIQMLALPCGRDIPVEQTRWLYGLLLRCSPLMTSEDIYILRELARRAIMVQRKLEKTREYTEQRQVDNVVEEGDKPQQNSPRRQRTAEVQAKGIGERDFEEIGDLEEDDQNFEIDGVDIVGQQDHQPDSGWEIQKISVELSTATEAQVPCASNEIEEGEVEGQNEDMELNLGNAYLSPKTDKQNSLGTNNEFDAVSETAPDTLPPGQIMQNRMRKKRKNRTLKTGEYDYVPSPNTLGTLDMVISIVGDIYGQRDLLEERVYYGHSVGSVSI